MKDQEKQGSAELIAIIVFVALIIGLVMTNRWLQKQASDIASKPIDAPTIETVSEKKQAPPTKKRKGEVVRKTRFSPDRKCKINVFYQEGVEIARNKSSKGKVYDQTGEIPDGKVKFTNESNGTYGVEYYRNGERHGPAKIYYKDGVLRQETYYQYGKLMTNTEYFQDGIVRMEEDYADAREYGDESEVGIGKVYFRDGTLKYEWYMTVTEPIGFKKSYNGKGRLVAEFYYDEYGQLMEPKETVPGLDVSPGTDAPIAADVPLNPEARTIINKPPKQIFIPNE